MAEFTKAQLLELIKDYPDDSVIEVCEYIESSYYGYASFTDLNPEKHVEIIDLRESRFVR